MKDWSIGVVPNIHNSGDKQSSVTNERQHKKSPSSKKREKNIYSVSQTSVKIEYL